MKKFHALCVTVLLSLFFCVSSVMAEQSSGRHDKDIEIRVQNDGERIIVQAAFVVPVTPQQAWAVLTDFDNIPNFIADVQSSKVTNKIGNNLVILQKSITKFGFFTFSFDSVREVNLSPFNRIQERMISGSMHKMEETTLLIPENGQTRIVYHADIVPGLWILRFAGQFFIENQARGQFRQIINEMIRRKQTVATSP